MKTKIPNIGKLTNAQLLDDHRLVHSYWSTMQTTGKAIVGGRNKEDLFNIHTMIIEEMKERGFAHHIRDKTLDKIALPKGLNLSETPDLILTEGFISLVGSTVEGRDANDTDILIRQKSRSPAIEKRIAAFFQNPHYIYDEVAGGQSIALYDLALVRRRNIILTEPEYSFLLFSAAPQNLSENRIFLHRQGDQILLLDEFGEEIDAEIPQELKTLKPDPAIIELSETFEPTDIWRWFSTELVKPSLSKEDRSFFLDKAGIELPLSEKATTNIEPLTPLKPLKAGVGYGKYEFNDPEKLAEAWAKDRYPIAVEEKFDGFRLQIHKAGDTVKIFTEDKRRDISANLPMIVEELKKLSEKELILDSEVVWWKEGKPIPRHRMMAIIAGKKPLTGEDIRANVFDCLYDEEALTGQPWTTRQEHLKKVLSKDTEHIKRVIPWIAKNEKELLSAIDKASKHIGSEGSMNKRTDSTYPLTGRTKDWAKYKKVLEITLKVIGIRQKRIGGKAVNTFLYRGAFLEDGKLKPMESQHILSPADMQEESEWNMGAGFERRKTGEYGYGETYGTAAKAKIGDLITVAPIHVLPFKGKDNQEHWAWMFPRFKNIEPAKTIPANVEGLRKLVKPGLRITELQAIFPLKLIEGGNYEKNV